MNMDISVLRTLVTVLSFAIFIGIVWWALAKSNRTRFEEAAMLPFADDDTAQLKEKASRTGARSSGAPQTQHRTQQTQGTQATQETREP